MTSQNIEFDYSKHLTTMLVKTELESHYEMLDILHNRICKWFEDYDNQVFPNYQSKTDRIAVLKLNIDSIPINLITTIVLLGESTLQAHATRLGLFYHDDNLTAAKSGSELLAICDGIGYEIIRPKLGSGQTFKVKPKLSLSQELKTNLKLRVFTPPQTLLPNAWTDNRHGGWDYVNKHVVLGGRFNHHDEKQNLSVLNTLQEVKYELNSTVLAYDDERETKDSTDEKLFQETLKENRLVYDLYKDKSFHFVFQYDKRGRVYDSGYHIHIQGNDYRKGLLNFNKSIQLSDKGWYWLKVDIANSLGKDKLLFDERVKFVEDNLDSILNDTESWLDKADSKFCFIGAVSNYKKSLETGYSNHIVRLDATCSGPQLMSVMMRDIDAMRELNVLGNERRDYYTTVSQLVYSKTKDSAIWGDNPNWTTIRSYTKKPIMVFYYNSESKPKEYFGDDTPELQAFYDSLYETTKGACTLKEFINELWDNKALSHNWTLPDGHRAICPVIGTKTSRIEVAEMKSGKAVFNYVHQLIKPGSTNKRSLCANLVHSVDGWVLRQVVTLLSEKGIEVSPIHDSFGVHPNYCDELRKAYRAVLARLYRTSIIDDIVKELGSNVELPRAQFDESVYEEILSNNEGYYLC